MTAGDAQSECGRTGEFLGDTEAEAEAEAEVEAEAEAEAEETTEESAGSCGYEPASRAAGGAKIAASH